MYFPRLMKGIALEKTVRENLCIKILCYTTTNKRIG